MRNSDKPIPFGCLVVFVIIVALYYTFSGESAQEKKWKEEDAKKLAKYKSNFDYDIDSIAMTISTYNYDPNIEKIKGKCLFLEDQNGKYLVNLVRMHNMNFKIPESLSAYKLKDLNTIIIQKYETVKTSDWGARSVENDQVELTFYDVSSSKVLYKTTIVGYSNPYVVKRGRRAGATSYSLSNSQIINEISRIINHE